MELNDRQRRTIEARLRRTLERRGYILRKSRRRDPKALDYGNYWITDTNTCIIFPSGPGAEFGADLGEIIQHVNE